MDASNASSVEPASIIDRLVEAGLLNETPRGDRLQFAYDPVAEFLAARWLSQTDDLQTLLDKLLNEHEQSPVAQAYRELRGAARASDQRFAAK